MKNIKIHTVIIFIFSIIVFSGFDGGAENQPAPKVMEFIAVMDLKCGEGIKKEQCAALTEVLIDELVKLKKYKIVDRANRDKILSEAGFQQTGCVDESCTIEMGRQLGVGKIVVGSLTMLGETYLVNLQLLNVETAAVENSTRETCEKCKIDNLISSISNAARKLMGEAPETPQPSPQPQTTLMSIETSTIANAGIFPSHQPGKAMVVIYRPEISPPEGGWVCQTVYDEAVMIGNLSSGSYFYYEAEPGKHDFKIRHGGIRFSTGYLSLSPGQTIFLKSGFNREGKGTMEMFLVDPNTGLVEVKKCKYRVK